MKLIIRHGRIAATATDSYEGPDAHMAAPADFDVARLADYVYADGVLALPDPPAPTTCTPAQGLVALFALQGIKEQDVLDAIEAITDPVLRYTAQIGFLRATEWRRESGTMQAMAALLGLGQADLDALFGYAAGVQV